MKTFFSVLAAILVSALIIGGAVSIISSSKAEADRRLRINKIVYDGKIAHEEELWKTQRSEHPDQPLDVDDLKRRLGKLQEQYEEGKPIQTSDERQ